jgi:hypothetical protein
VATTPTSVPAPRVESIAANPKDIPAASPRASAAAAKDADDAAIRSVIATYGRAIESKDIALFRSIKPNLTAQEERRLQDSFRAVTSQRVTLSVISIDYKGDQASAALRRRDEIEAGGRRQATDSKQVLTLSRAGASWVITEIR